MSEAGENDEVVEMTSALARLLRQSISNDQEEVELEKEIEYVKNYLTIQKMRYKDKLEFFIYVDPRVAHVPIIKLVLQPLVENAIYHGIKYKETKGNLKIYARPVDGRVEIVVADDGIGMDEDVMEHIFDEHGSVFECLLDLDKQMNGLSDAQKDVLEGLYYEKDNKAIGEEMGISDATVRTYKFNLQKMKRRARIFLAMMEQIENEEIIALRKRLEPEQNVENIRKPHFDTQFGCKSLHPFFTQYNFK